MKRQSRRRFLGSASMGLAGAHARMSIAQDAPAGLIDAHVHVWTPDTESYPISPNFEIKDMDPASFLPSELQTAQVGSGVARTVLIQMSFYEFDNRFMLKAIADHPGRFGGVAIVDHEKPAVGKTMRSLAERGVKGFRLYAFSDKVKHWEQSKGIETMWKTGGTEGLAMCCLTDPASLPLIHRMCQMHPETPVVIDHFARIGMRGDVDQKELDSLLRLADFPNTYVKTSAFYALGKKEPPYEDLAPLFRQVYNAFGSERLMWGSDCPYQIQGDHTYAASIGLVKDRLNFLTVEDKQNILQNTASKLFFS